MPELNLETLNRDFADKTPREIMQYAAQTFGISKVTLASSLSIEDQVLTHILLNIDKNARIFFIDTGRHFQETYHLLEETMHKYKFLYEIYAPESGDLESMMSTHGPNLFYESVEMRKKCCNVRKVKPLRRVLGTVDAWICGLRRDQSQTRQDVNLFEWDALHQITKVNPLALWDEAQVWDYIKQEKIPYNSLYVDGFRSIGCQPCTRAVGPDGDVRSGRWWWEDPDKKECGLHAPHCNCAKPKE